MATYRGGGLTSTILATVRFMSDQDEYGDPTRVDLPSVDSTQAMPVAAGPPPSAPRPPTGEPPAEPPERRWWILAGLLIAVLVIGLAIVVLMADDDDGNASGSTTTEATTTSTTEATTTTTTEATTTTAATTTTTAGPSPTVAPGLCVSSAPDDPETAAQVVFQAWTLRDATCAGNLMTANARDQLFALNGDGSDMTFAGCFDQDNPDPHTLCSFTYPGGATNYRMNYSETEGWTVYDVFQAAD